MQSQIQNPTWEERDILRIGKETQEHILWAESYPILKYNNIRLLGTSRIDKGDFFIQRTHPDLQQVLITTAGTGIGWAGNKWNPLSEGSAYLTPSSAPHAYQSQGQWQIVWCVFTADAFPDFQDAVLIRQTNPRLWQCIISGILEEAAGNADNVQMERWIELLRHECFQIIRHNRKHHLPRLWSHVMANLQMPWTLSMLASKSGLNRETLRQACMEEYGIGPVAYLTKLRMRHAAAILEHGQNVTDAAQMVGYQNPFSFSVAFQRVMGYPPSSLKKRLSAK